MVTSKSNVQKKLKKTKNIEIDLESDSKDQIIEKLVLLVEVLKEEIKDLKVYSEGTYCTSTEHYRFKDIVEKELLELSNRIDDN